MNEHSAAYEKAKKYYPTLWSEKYLRQLVKKNLLTAAEFTEITGKDY